MSYMEDTYAGYVARQQGAKKEALLARKKEKVWRAHLKRQCKHTASLHLGRATAFVLVCGRTQQLWRTTGNGPVARKMYLQKASHDNRMRYIATVNRHQPLP